MNEDLDRLRGIADFQFGHGAGRLLFPDGIRIEYSRSTNRPRHIYIDDTMIANFRPTDALLTVTIAGAERLNQLPGFTGYVVVIDDVLEFIEQGKNLFARHVVEAGPGIRPEDEVIVRNTKGDVLGVGRAVLTSDEMLRFKTGLAVNIRRGRVRHK